MNNLAPIVLFTYSRLDTLKKTINFLKKNKLARFSEIFIYSDGQKSQIDKHYVLNVRKYLKRITGFKKKTIIYRKKNYGLSANIQKGVTEVINNFGKVIVLEDDVLVAKNFLNYMNEALNYYANKKKVFHINSWNYELNYKNKDFSKTFLIRLMNCWGWATWKDRWLGFVKNPKKCTKNFSNEDIKNFNIGNNYNYWSQVERNKDKKINTWAIFWYAYIFKNSGLCVSPLIGLSKNIGSDVFSVHTSSDDNALSAIPKYFFKMQNKKFIFENNLIENKLFLEKIIKKIKSKKNITDLLFRVLLKLIKVINFKTFALANFFSKFLFFHNFQSNKINFFKVQSFKNQKKINLINSISLKLYLDTVHAYKKIYKKYPKNILDVGGALGENIIELKSKHNIKIDCTVLENESLVKIVRKNKIKHCKFTSDVNVSQEKPDFDIVIFSGVLQYLPNPYLILKKIKQKAKGLIVIGRLDTNITGSRIQWSKLYQNVPFVSNLPINKNEIVFYPMQNISIKKLSLILNDFKVYSENRDKNNNLNIIYQKKFL